MTNQIRLALIATSIAACGLPHRALAQVAVPDVTLVQIFGPGHAYPTEHVSLCFSRLDYPYVPENRGGSGGDSFVPKKAATVTLRIVEMTTGTEVAKNVISVTPGALPGDPCIEYVVPSSTTSTALPASLIGGGSTPAYIGLVSDKHKDWFLENEPPSAVTASFQIFALGADGLPVNPRVIPASVTCQADAFPCSY